MEGKKEKKNNNDNNNNDNHKFRQIRLEAADD